MLFTPGVKELNLS